MPTGILHLHLALALLLFGLSLAGRIARYRGLSASVALLLLVTGVHNFMTRMQPAPPGWHMWIGIKTLLALHVIGIVLLSVRGAASPEKLARWRKGALVSAGLTILIGLYLSNFAR
ncbi:MAG TPA: hypothetical protein PKJ41_16865 [Bryobacteraceae bacterium]|nr:hypothetical protein [Bryobacteraceae bacterium]HPT29200.1 hypothetical protein [Bryobacteraceae bacterium]